jgi:hypothetical protein
VDLPGDRDGRTPPSHSVNGPQADRATLHAARALVWFGYHSTEHSFAATGRSQHVSGQAAIIGTKRSNGARPDTRAC